MTMTMTVSTLASGRMRLSRLLCRYALLAGLIAAPFLATVAPEVQARTPVAGQQLEIPSHLFALSHPVGQQRLLQSSYSQAYWPLATYFETQRNQAYCSVATSVIALNALGIKRPATALFPDFPFFTQQDFFTGVDARTADPEVVAREGMTLAQLGSVLASYPVSVDSISADTLDVAQLRELLKKHLREQDRFVLFNFNRRFIGEVGGGHWSPLAAYHEASDSVLLMDVARYKYPPVWVPLADLLRGAQDHDSVSGKARGLLIVSARQQP
jgi:hypothetical protein